MVEHPALESPLCDAQPLPVFHPMNAKRRTITIVPLLLAAAIAAFQYFSAEKVTIDDTGRTVRVALSYEQEQALGLQSYREVLAQNRVVRTGPQHELVAGVAQRLAQAIGAAGEGFEWEVSVLESLQANAFCLPGGKIAVHTGILPYTQNDSGLAAVMGHEMAHAIARHGSQRLLRSSVAQTVMIGASLSFTDMEPQQRRMVLAALGAGAQFGVILPFSRGHETEADEMGLIYMARAGFDPREAVAFWERMAGAGGSQPPEFASTHPSHATRIQHLQAILPKALAEYTQQIGR